jgi:hypothetical protein
VEVVGTLDLGDDECSGIVRCCLGLEPDRGFARIEHVCLAQLGTGARRITGCQQVFLFIGRDRK